MKYQLAVINKFHEISQPPRIEQNLSSPRAKRAGPLGFYWQTELPQWEGEDFLSRQPNFFTETAVTPERKVEKWFPRWEINRHAEG